MSGRAKLDPSLLPPSPDLRHERRCLARGWRAIAGVDEAGRGAWAGPVVAAAVILPPCHGRASERHLLDTLSGVRDSKELTPRQRDYWIEKILEVALAVGVGGCGPGEVDGDGLIPGTRAAMERALACLPVPPDCLLLDAIRLPDVSLPQTDLIKGDMRSLSIAAASVVAKVSRDRAVAKLDEIYPGYGFARHKGYGTAAHQAALKALGPCPAHRRSYAPVQALGACVLGEVEAPC